MNSRGATVFVLVLLLVPVLLGTIVVLAPAARAASATPVTGSITGPKVVATQSTTAYYIRGFGGPAVAPNGTVVGNLTYYSTLVGPNLTGVSFLPTSGNFTSNQSKTADLTVGNATETITINLMVSSVYQGKNESTNFSYSVSIAQPFVISTTIYIHSTWVLGFTLLVTLDGVVIGNVSVPALPAGGTYQLKFEYAIVGLSAGDHTFAISLAQEHGLVTFANGQTTYSETVYVTGPATDYTLWYVVGIVAFFGVVFIFTTRVAARRRGATRR